jgi:hypothetical protein
VAEWTDWTWTFSKTRRSTRTKEVENDGGGLDTLAQLLLGRDSNDRKTAFTADLRDLIVRWQEADGSWKAAGQLPSLGRPIEETNTVSTMWAALALKTSNKSDRAAQEAVKRAVVTIQKSAAGQTTDRLAVSLLFEHYLGTPRIAKRKLSELIRRQNADGGWAWKGSGSSDAFATGLALYALGKSGSAAGQHSIDRGVRYLLVTQQENGAWPVPPSAVSSARDPIRTGKLESIYRYWGTAWASIGLSTTLARTSYNDRDRREPQFPDWMRTCVYGGANVPPELKVPPPE